MHGDLEQQILSTSQALTDKGEFEAALQILGDLDCIMASWLRGRNYLAAAENLSKSIMYMYCGTGETKQQYQNLLYQAQTHLHKTASLLVDAGQDMQNHLNPYLWGQINKVEHKIYETRPIDVGESYDIWEDEEDNSFPSHRTDDLIDELSEWKL